MASEKVHTGAVVAAGLTLGVILLATAGKRKKCLDLPGIYDPNSPLHLTKDAQAQAIQLAKKSIYQYAVSNSNYTLGDVVMSVADGLQECKWEKLESDQQKKVWNGLSQIVKTEIQAYEQDRTAWMASFSG